MDSIFIKLLALVATSFWWFPILRTLCLEAWRVSSADDTPKDKVPGIPAGITRASQGWKAKNHEEQGVKNSAWSIGRRKPVHRSTSFPATGEELGHDRVQLPTAFQRSRR